MHNTHPSDSTAVSSSLASDFTIFIKSKLRDRQDRGFAIKYLSPDTPLDRTSEDYVGPRGSREAKHFKSFRYRRPQCIDNGWNFRDWVHDCQGTHCKWHPTIIHHRNRTQCNCRPESCRTAPICQRKRAQSSNLWVTLV